jgi:hypothetical protein
MLGHIFKGIGRACIIERMSGYVASGWPGPSAPVCESLERRAVARDFSQLEDPGEGVGRCNRPSVVAPKSWPRATLNRVRI